MLLHYRRDRRAFERNVAGKHLEQHHAQRIKARTRIRFFIGPLLWGHVVWRTHQPGRLCLYERAKKLAGFDLCEAKVEYLDRSRHIRLVAADHYIQRLEIAMNDALMMRRADACADSGDQF